MITGELKLTAFGVLSGRGGHQQIPMEVIEQITYLLFIKRLDELHTVQEAKANRLKKPVQNAVFRPKQQVLRWSRLKERSASDDADLRGLCGSLPFALRILRAKTQRPQSNQPTTTPSV